MNIWWVILLVHQYSSGEYDDAGAEDFWKNHSIP